MTFDINRFRNQGVTRGGARPSLFTVKLITVPAGIPNASEKFTFTCRASQIPPSIVDSVEVPYFGRKIKFAGDRTFPDWNVTVINDEGYQVRDMFEEWSALLNDYTANIKRAPFNTYKCDALITHYRKDGGLNKEYQLVGIFPTSVDAMDLDWDATNTIQTFGVTFAYDYWVPLSVQNNGIPIRTPANARNPGGTSIGSGPPDPQAS